VRRASPELIVRAAGRRACGRHAGAHIARVGGTRGATQRRRLCAPRAGPVGTLRRVLHMAVDAAEAARHADDAGRETHGKGATASQAP